jgi:Glucanosyltransferase
MELTEQGSRFFHNNGTEFFIKGVNYSPGGSYKALYAVDTISDGSICSRDIPYLLQLGINTVVIYDATHDGHPIVCMNMLEKAGIYALIHLNGQGVPGVIAPGSKYPSTPTDYTLIEHFDQIIDLYQGFPNTLGFLLGLGPNRIPNLPERKAWIKHAKNYIVGKKYRNIPVGVRFPDLVRSWINRLVCMKGLTTFSRPRFQPEPKARSICYVDKVKSGRTSIGWIGQMHRNALTLLSFSIITFMRSLPITQHLLSLAWAVRDLIIPTFQI